MLAVAKSSFWERMDALLAHLSNLLLAVLIIALVWTATVFVRKLIKRSVTDPAKKYALSKTLTLISLFVTVAVAAVLLLGKLGGLAAIIGLIGAGVAVALQDVLRSLFCWPLILGDKGFSVGDRIECGSIKGDVIDIGMLRTTLLEVGGWSLGDQSTGRIIQVANKFILENPLFNYTHGFEVTWQEISILVTFESDWKRAEEIMYQSAVHLTEEKEKKLERDFAALQDKYLVKRGTTTPYVYASIEDSGVKLTLRFLVEARKRRVVHDAVTREILAKLAQEPLVELAYPTMRLYRRGE